MLGRLLLVVVVALAGCVRTGSVSCGDAMLCPRDTVCEVITANAEKRCVPNLDVAACADKAVLADCTLAGGDPGSCYETTDGLACLVGGCGNGITDTALGEVCDDGNATVGDGCSYGCRSDETCGNGKLDPIKLASDGTPIANESCDDGNVIGHDGCSGSCDPEAARWVKLRFETNPATASAGAVYDSGRDRVVMFGGYRLTGIANTAHYYDDTWEYDGIGWSVAALTIHPARRVAPAMAYDAAHHRTLLFGGILPDETKPGDPHAGTVFGDTWQWDGATWQARPGASPSPRANAAMVYDAVRKRIVMFGGAMLDGTRLDDTWEWDGDRWTMRALPTRPPPTSEHALVFDPVHGVVVLVGGTTAGSPPGDTYTLDATGWTKMTAVTPPNIFGGSAAWDVMTQRVVVYGGHVPGDSNQAVAEMWAWDGQGWTAIAAVDPGARHSEVLTSTRTGLVMYGGYAPSACGACSREVGDTWQWNGAAWSKITIPSVPASLETVLRRYHCTEWRRQVPSSCPSHPQFQVEKSPPRRASAIVSQM